MLRYALLAAIVVLSLTLHATESSIAESNDGVTMAAFGVRQPQLLDINRQKIDQPLEVGQQALVRITIHNNNLDSDMHFVVIAEVRDGNGVTQYLAWQASNAAANGDYTFEASWMPIERVCSGIDNSCGSGYQVRAFVISDFENPQVFSGVQSLQGISVIDTTVDEEKIYKLTFQNRKFDIPYTLDGGHITSMLYDKGTATIVLALDVPKDAELGIELPKRMLDSSFLCQINGVPGGSDVPLEVFIDTMSSGYKFTDLGESFRMQIMLVAGTEEVEAVGCGFL